MKAVPLGPSNRTYLLDLALKCTYITTNTTLLLPLVFLYILAGISVHYLLYLFILFIYLFIWMESSLRLVLFIKLPEIPGWLVGWWKIFKVGLCHIQHY